MKQTCHILSTYAADVSGVCSALYEMGGMTIMHDASGCNSTYNTHDEPRWYSNPSMVFISALSETEAMLGDESKMIGDITQAAKELQPRFIAIAGTPIPMMMGTDFSGVAKDIEAASGIPTFGFATNGMHSYVCGAGRALAAVAERFCDRGAAAEKLAAAAVVNILGVTPLDFSITGNVTAIKEYFVKNGFKVQSIWAMESEWDELMQAGRANVNVVVSSSGLPLAKTLKNIFGTPYVTGIPLGEKFGQKLLSSVREAASSGTDICAAAGTKKTIKCGKRIYAVGEAVWAASVCASLREDFGFTNVSAIAAADGGEALIGEGDYAIIDEDDIFAKLIDAGAVIADPLYKPALPGIDRQFIPFPHEGYSGRIYRKDIPLMVGENFNIWFGREIKK